MKPDFISRLKGPVTRELIGGSDEMERRLKAAFGNVDFSEQIEKMRRRSAMCWLVCAGLSALLCAAAITQSVRGGASITVLERPPYLAGPTRVSAVAEAEYEGESVRRDVELTVRPRALDDEEKTALIHDTALRLPNLILGRNESLSCVASDLDLIGFDGETGVNISWTSENPALISDDGALNGVTGRAGDRIELKARLSLENVSEAVGITGVLGVPAAEDGVAEDVAEVLSETVAGLSASADGDALVLPGTDAHGVSYRFSENASDLHIPEIIALAAFVLFLRRGRYGWIDKRIKESRREIVRDFPEFIDRLLLMLNAGLVVSEALSRIAAEYELHRDASKPRRLYEELAAIRQRVQNTNASLSAELGAVAARSGVRELTRFASVVSDNIDKGSALAEKLKAEGELVWKLRKKDVEEAGRLAETKMILPMTLTLLTLVMITMAPAVLDMR
jgi:hypothetical protein